MGVSSYTCAKTNLPIVTWGESRILGKDLNNILFYPGPGKRPIPGWLDEYSNFISEKGTIDIVETRYYEKIESGEAKFAIRDFLEKGDTFGKIGKSYPDPGQGGMTYSRGFLTKAVKAGGFKNILGLEVAFYADVPLDIALHIDDEASKRYHAFEGMIVEGYEQGILELIPGQPESGRPGSIGKFYHGEIAPLNSECTEINFSPYGDPRPKPQRFRYSDGTFSPDPVEYARALAADGTLGRKRSAVFEGDDGTSYTVSTYGGRYYTVEGTDYPLKAFIQIDHALNTIGFDLAYPASLDRVNPEAGSFFSTYREDEKPDTATFPLPSAGSAPRP